MLDVVDAGEGADVVAVEDDFAGKEGPVGFDVVVFDHDDDHVDIGKELVEVIILIFGNLMILQEGIIAL